MKTEYVCGLLFVDSCEWVALITKHRPLWQRGKLNGIGGKIEAKDHRSPADAMMREFREEAGDYKAKFKEFAVTEGKDWIIHWFVCSDNAARIRSMTDEPINFYKVDGLHLLDTVKDLRLMVDIALVVIDRSAPDDKFILSAWSD